MEAGILVNIIIFCVFLIKKIANKYEGYGGDNRYYDSSKYGGYFERSIFLDEEEIFFLYLKKAIQIILI